MRLIVGRPSVNEETDRQEDRPGREQLQPDFGLHCNASALVAILGVILGLLLLQGLDVLGGIDREPPHAEQRAHTESQVYEPDVARAKAVEALEDKRHRREQDVQVPIHQDHVHGKNGTNRREEEQLRRPDDAQRDEILLGKPLVQAGPVRRVPRLLAQPAGLPLQEDGRVALAHQQQHGDGQRPADDGDDPEHPPPALVLL